MATTEDRFACRRVSPALLVFAARSRVERSVANRTQQKRSRTQSLNPRDASRSTKRRNSVMPGEAPRTDGHQISDAVRAIASKLVQDRRDQAGRLGQVEPQTTREPLLSKAADLNERHQLMLSLVQAKGQIDELSGRSNIDKSAYAGDTDSDAQHEAGAYRPLGAGARACRAVGRREGDARRGASGSKRRRACPRAGAHSEDAQSQADAKTERRKGDGRVGSITVRRSAVLLALAALRSRCSIAYRAMTRGQSSVCTEGIERKHRRARHRSILRPRQRSGPCLQGQYTPAMATTDP